MLLVEERCTVQWAVTVVEASAAGAGAADVAVAGPHWSTPEHRPNCPHPTNRIPLPLNRPRRGHRHHSVDPGSGTAAVDRDCVDCRRSADHRRNCVGRRCRRTTDHLVGGCDGDRESHRLDRVVVGPPPWLGSQNLRACCACIRPMPHANHRLLEDCTIQKLPQWLVHNPSNVQV